MLKYIKNFLLGVLVICAVPLMIVAVIVYCIHELGASTIRMWNDETPVHGENRGSRGKRA